MNEVLIAELTERIAQLEMALHEISLGEGAFSRDPMEHAQNTIENMKAIALRALEPQREEKERSMGAETRVYVKVLKARYEWVEVSAVTLSEAMDKASQLPGVIQPVEASYELGGVVT